MLQSPHFTRAPVREKPGFKMFFGDIKHKECGTVVPTAFTARNFEAGTWEFAVKCPQCGTLGGTGQWDSLPIKTPEAKV